MKTIFRNLFTALVALFFLSQSYAQKEFVWDYYKIGVTLPNDFKVVTNNDNEFECSGQAMHLYMYVFEDGSLSSSDMHTATAELAKELKFEAKDETYDINDAEFSGKYILGYKDGLQVMLAGLIDKKHATNLWVFIIFQDGDEVATEDGIAIINSLHSK